MSFRHRIGGAFAGAVLALTGAAAWADELTDQAQALVTGGRAAEAYALLAPQAASRAGDPTFDYLLGVAAADTGRAADAIIALQRVLAVQPDNQPARAELARAYALAGDAQTARQEFERLNTDPSIPDPVRQQFSRILGDIDRATGVGVDVTGFVEAGGGYDSNVNSATAETSLVIPLFAGLGPAALSGAAIANEDAFARLEGGVSVVNGVNERTRIFGSLLGSLRENESASAFSTAALTATGGAAYTFADRSVLTGSLNYQTLWIGGDVYRETAGGGVQYTREAGPGAITLSAQVFDLSHDADPLRDGTRYAGGVSYSWRNGVVTAQGGREELTAGTVSNDFYGASVSYEHELMPRLSLTAIAAYEARDYDDVDPLFLTAREDEQFDAALGLRWQARENMFVVPTVTYTDSSSNIAIYDYDRVTASVSLRFEF